MLTDHELNGDHTPALQAYLLGSVDFDAALALQRWLVYQVSGAPEKAALMLCEHPPMVTVGRQGSRAHLDPEFDTLRTEPWRIRWVNRGGGCWLHLPGQLAIYPIVSLPKLGLGIVEYLDRLQRILAAVLDDFSVSAQSRPDTLGLWSRERPIASLGIAIRGWVAYYGATLNIDPDLEPYRYIRCHPPSHAPMTSLFCERGGPMRVSMVRERLVETFAEAMGFSRTSLFFDHPILQRKAPFDAVAAHS